jgi:hypothetical protein
MKSKQFLILISLAFLFNSCGSIYKKHYESGYTFIKHKKKSSPEVATKSIDLQQNTLNVVSQQIKKEKETELKESKANYHTYHSELFKGKKGTPIRLTSNTNNFSMSKIGALKRDTIYRKEPPKSVPVSDAVSNKAQASLIFSIVSVAVFFLFLFFFLFILSLIPAIIALVMARKANAMAKLNGEPLPNDARIAKILAWVTIGLNLLAILLLLLYLIFIIILIGGI